MTLPQHIVDQMANALCSVCSQVVQTKGRATHAPCSLAQTQATYGFPQTFIAGVREDR